MSLGLYAKPINGFVVPIIHPEVRIIPMGLVVLCCAVAATLSIGFRDPRADYFYEGVLFSAAAYWCCTTRELGMKPIPFVALTLILSWGFFQLTLGATVYRYATLTSSLRGAALAATAWIGCSTLRSDRLRTKFLRVFVWFGVMIAIASVLAYFTSPGKILWIFPAPYPDVWGPFLSRNNFAQFLELAMPVALWFGLREPKGDVFYILMAAVMLAAGLASASRAGSVILVAEAIVSFWIHRRSPHLRRLSAGLLFATIFLAAIPGIENLAGRLRVPDPYQGRREIARSTLHMISARPWTGFGLGTYSTVYPAYATFDTGQSVDHAHNDWLEWAAEGGIPYASIWIVLALWSVRLAWRSGWGIGVLGCFLHGLVDYPFARLGISAWIFLLLGMLAATEVREVPDRRH